MPKRPEITYEKVDSMCWESLKKTIERLKENKVTYKIGETVAQVAYPIEETTIKTLKKNNIFIVPEESNKDEKWECLIGLMEKEKTENPSTFQETFEDFYILMKKIEKVYS